MKKILAVILAVITWAAPARGVANDKDSDPSYKIVKWQLAPGLTMCSTSYFDWYDENGNQICRGYISCTKYEDSLALAFIIKKDEGELSNRLSKLMNLTAPDRPHDSDSCTISLQSVDNSRIYVSDSFVGDIIYSLISADKEPVWDNNDDIFIISVPIHASRMYNTRSTNKIWNYLKSNSIKNLCVSLSNAHTGELRVKIDIPITFPLHRIVTQLDEEMKH